MLCFLLGNLLLEHSVYSSTLVKQVEQRKSAELEKYITEETVTTETVGQLNVWCRRGDRIDLSIYQGGRLLYSTGEGKIAEKSDPYVYEDMSRRHEMKLSDGTPVEVFLYYYAGDAYYYAMLVVCAVLACAVFTVGLIALTHRKVMYIKKVRTELEILAGGDLSYPVSVEGNDELSELAEGIDAMRKSVLFHQKSEEQARRANSQLVTAMSHDLRTPLTALIGYLELLTREKYQGETQREEFTRRSYAKAMQIRDMADKLFEYFLVYSSEGENTPMEQLEANQLLDTVWSDYSVALAAGDFQTEEHFAPIHGQLSVNIDLLHRVFDNLYSNLTKYADRTVPIQVSCGMDGKFLTIGIRNVICPQRSHKTGTNIGLKTCDRIMKAHGGEFHYEEENDAFFVLLRFPVA